MKADQRHAALIAMPADASLWMVRSGAVKKQANDVGSPIHPRFAALSRLVIARFHPSFFAFPQPVDCAPPIGFSPHLFSAPLLLNGRLCWRSPGYAQKFATPSLASVTAG
jgi:hypothetical protein